MPRLPPLGDISNEISNESQMKAKWATLKNANANPYPSPLLDANCHKNRGIAHDTTGQLLCPAEFDWDNLV